MTVATCEPPAAVDAGDDDFPELEEHPALTTTTHNVNVQNTLRDPIRPYLPAAT
ncbi:MAG TPA: hypothetical protein VIK54_09655 [Acidimicrobiia bacterium]